MRRILFGLSILLMINLIGIEDYYSKQLIVKTTNPVQIRNTKFGLTSFDNYLERFEIKDIKSIRPIADNRYFLINTEEEIPFSLLDKIRFDGIEYIQPNFLNETCVVPNDPHYYEQLLNNVNLPEAWNFAVGSENVIIATVDSGLHFDHPDLQKNVFINNQEIPDDGIDNDMNGFIDDWHGYDFTDAPEYEAIALGDYLDQDNDPEDDNNHGTHVGGIIAATSNNNEGIAGICWNCQLLVVRAGFNTTITGYLQDDDAAAAIFYATDMGADVISLSWGDSNYSPIIADACLYAYEHGTIVVAAAGNDGSAPPVYPARLSTTIAVGAVTPDNELAVFSNYGTNLDLVAPGTGVLSTYDVVEGNLYKLQDGTSMSAPFVAGAVGLLLSEEPNLSLEQVKSRLAASCDDLGETGFDNLYGYGMLNVYQLLSDSDVPLVEISYPTDFQAFHQDFDILGIVQVSDFKYYSVMYTTEVEPTDTDWFNVSNHQNSPYKYYSQVENDVLAKFIVDDVSSELKQYQIRVQVFTNDHDIYSYVRTIQIDKTEPVFLDSLSGYEKRFAEESSVFYIQSFYNEPVHQVLNLDDGIQHFELISATCDSIHISQVPQTIPEGTYSLSVFSTNEAGLSVTGSLPFELELQYQSIDPNGYSQIELGNELMLTRYLGDFDGNGLNEFYGYEKSSEGDSVRIFEIQQNQLVTKHTFPNFMLPRAFGNTNSYGKEVIGIFGDVARIFETNFDYYPSETSFFSWNYAFGADFIDYDNNGTDEVAIVQNINKKSRVERVVTIYKRYNNVFEEVVTLHNLSGGIPEQNIFVNKVCCTNLDGDASMDILTADKEGDVMIFEADTLSWMHRAPIANTYFLATGNFIGHTDDKQDFCVGGYNYDPDNSSSNLAYFEFYTYNQEIQNYMKIGYVSFDDVGIHNSIACTDITSDGTDEIVCDVAPNLYIVDFLDFDNDGAYEFVPIWKGESNSELQNTIFANPETEHQQGYIISNRSVNGEMKSFITMKNSTVLPLLAPEYFSVNPLNENSVLLNWKSNESAQSYSIYRKIGNTTEMITTTTETDFIDNEVSVGDTIWYQVTSVNDEYNPSESLPTLWKKAIPQFSPKLLSVEMTSHHDIRMIFDQSLSIQALDRANYLLNNGYSYPHSVNWVSGHQGVNLHYQEQFLEPNLEEDSDLYQIRISNLTGITGVPFLDENYPENIIPIIFKEDILPPKIVSSEKSGEKMVNIYFSEAMDEDSVENEENYQIIYPVTDQDNAVQSIYYQESANQYWVEISFRNKPIRTNQLYFLKLVNAKDIAGNTIQNLGNKIEFTLNDIAKLTDHVVAPNPYKTKIHDSTKFFLPIGKAGTISIYDLSGALVFEDSFEPLTRLVNFYEWNGKNGTSQSVSSGLYMYIIKMGNDLVRGKIAVIH